MYGNDAWYRLDKQSAEFITFCKALQLDSQYYVNEIWQYKSHTIHIECKIWFLIQT